MHPPDFVLGALARLTDAGYDASIVGGAVRDSLLHRPIPDWDVATSAPPKVIRELFSDQTTYHLKHETVTIVLPGNRLEITPYRGPERTLEGDLARRDFTINAMAYDPARKRLFDPWDGRKDLKKRILRATADPDARFREDPIRVLRGIRLAVELGFAIDQRTLGYMEIHARLLRREAPERIREEVAKILMCDHPRRGFKLLSDHGQLEHIIPELCEGEGMEQNIHHRFPIFEHALETVERVPQLLHLRLAALLHDVAKPRVRTPGPNGWRFLGHARESAQLAENILARLRFPRLLTEKVSHLIAEHMVEYTSQWSDGAIRRLIGRTGIENIDDLLTLRKADLLAHGTGENGAQLLEELQGRIAVIMGREEATSVQQLAISGYDVMDALRLKPGPLVGAILRHLLEIVLDNPQLNNPRDLRTLLKETPPDFTP